MLTSNRNHLPAPLPLPFLPFAPAADSSCLVTAHRCPYAAHNQQQTYSDIDICDYPIGEGCWQIYCRSFRIHWSSVRISENIDFGECTWWAGMPCMFHNGVMYSVYPNWLGALYPSRVVAIFFIMADRPLIRVTACRPSSSKSSIMIFVKGSLLLVFLNFRPHPASDMILDAISTICSALAACQIQKYELW